MCNPQERSCYIPMTCGLLARRRASARAERAIKKNCTLQNLRNFAGRFQMGQTRRVLSGVKKSRAKFPPPAVKVKKRRF
jgi:hypothetical protein